VITLRECGLSDLEELQALSRRTFSESFADFNTPENMEDYLEKSFNTEILRAELSNGATAFYFLLDGDLPAGYMKLNCPPCQTDLNDDESLELERIYVVKALQNKKLGQLLIDKAVQIAKERAKSYIWLGVWNKNEGAIRFYKRNGFYKAGEHSFFLGAEEQSDFIMRKDI